MKQRGDIEIGFGFETCHAHAAGEDLGDVVERVLAIVGPSTSSTRTTPATHPAPEPTVTRTSARAPWAPRPSGT